MSAALVKSASHVNGIVIINGMGHGSGSLVKIRLKRLDRDMECDMKTHSGMHAGYLCIALIKLL